MSIFINGKAVYTSCRDRDLPILAGKCDTVLYVTQKAYNNMSIRFSNECKIRKVQVKVIDAGKDS